MARISTLVLILVALASGGCGGDDEDAEPERPPAASDTQTATKDDTTATTGGDESSEAGTGAEDPADDEPGRRAFIRRADRVCADVREEIGERGRRIADLARDAAQGEVDPPAYFRQSARLTAASAGAAERAIDQIEGLPRPADRREALERYLEAAHEQAAYLAEQAEALGRRDQERIAELNRVTTKTSKRIRSAARAFGFEVCGGG